VRKTKLLIIEDEKTIAIALRTRLSAAGYDVAVAPDGESGLDRLDDWCPDVILLDIRLPGIDGFEVCRRVKKNLDKASAEIIFLSANVTDDVREQAMNAGAFDVIAKPYEAKRLLEAIRSATLGLTGLPPLALVGDSS